MCLLRLSVLLIKCDETPASTIAMSQTQTVTETQNVTLSLPDGPPAFTGPSPGLGHDLELPSYTTIHGQQADSPSPPPPSDPTVVRAPSASPNVPSQVLRTECSRALETAKGKKWLQLFVKSRASTSASLPMFFEGDVIAGRVELDLDKAEGCKGVTIRVSALLRDRGSYH